ncbi:hypothetical protein [Paenibacillus lemnae]|uniref:Uncharacterized protein n=1 Tax=Paenibacillus lemnae TaxID=1330551 RepID=A0A848MCF0_PAELE|nr:hypothetical protein [Paenibacillus lemnae]NMO97909.1 hypothetical protein [Paenibacillus lemnae]
MELNQRSIPCLSLRLAGDASLVWTEFKSAALALTPAVSDIMGTSY